MRVCQGNHNAKSQVWFTENNQSSQYISTGLFFLENLYFSRHIIGQGSKVMVLRSIKYQGQYRQREE